MKSLSTTRSNQILALLAVAQLMGVLDFSIVNIALPSIQRMFHLAPADLQWVVSAYALVFGGFLLLGGRAADLFGRFSSSKQCSVISRSSHHASLAL
jgi:MFS family permease